MSGRPPSWLIPSAPRVDLASREGRVRALGEAARALIVGEPLLNETRMFLGACLSAWLARGGSLERDHLRVAAPAGSHRTPAWVWRSSSRGQQGDDYADTVESQSNHEEQKR